MEYLIGIDAGSTNYKAIACDFDGKFLASAKRPAYTSFLSHGRAETLAEKIWEGVSACVREVALQFPDDRCVGIGIASSGEDVLIDEEGKSVYPAIRWFDTRTEDIAQEWAEFGRDRVYQITGINPNPVASITKMQWIKRYQPEAMAKARYWIPIAGLVAFMMTGKARAAWTNACRSMAFDINTRQWSEEILAASDLDAALLPEPIRPGEEIGKMTRQAAEGLGLYEGLPVFAGGVDYACGTFATGIIQSGQMLDSTGTSEQLVVIVDRPRVDPVFISDNFTSVCYVVNDKYYIMGQMKTSGGILEWFKHLFGDVGFDTLMKEAEGSSIGAGGCMLLPHFAGRFTLGNDSAARGAFVGLTRGTTRGDMVRAILEGLCYEMHSIIQEIEEISSEQVHSIYAIGGATNSDFWLQMKADVTGIIIKSKDVPESAALGAAMLAGLGAGVYASLEEAVGKVSFPEKEYRPDEGNHKRYMEIYNGLYKGLYETLKPFNDRAAELLDDMK